MKGIICKFHKADIGKFGYRIFDEH